MRIVIQKVLLYEMLQNTVFIPCVYSSFSAVLDKLLFVLIYSFIPLCEKCQIFCSHTEIDTHTRFLLVFCICVCVCVKKLLCCRAGWPMGSPRCSPDEGVFTGVSLLLCPLVVCLVPQEQQALNWLGLWPSHPTWPVWAGEGPLPALEDCPCNYCAHPPSFSKLKQVQVHVHNGH